MPHRGPHTGVDLRDLTWFEDANRGTLSRDGARFALELAQFSYDFQASPWLAAGWTDLSIQVDNRLLSGVRSTGEERDWRQQILNALVPRLARGLTVISNPLSEVRGGLRLEFSRETGKAVTMLLPGEDGVMTIAVGFMGTGRRPQDWAGNMRFHHEDGLHGGFEAIAMQFEQNAANIHFPAAARALGLSSLTMKDALERTKRSGSPFRFVLAGHSQGAAVMQAWSWRRLAEGVRAENVTGFGFASPMAAMGSFADNPPLPLTHFLYSDDIFTRMGLYRHLGRVYLLRADDRLRALCYGKAMEDPLFLSVLDLLDRQRQVGQALVLCMGYLEALSGRPYKIIGNALSAFFESVLMELPAVAEEWIRRVLRFTRRSFRRYYLEATGLEPDEGDIEALRDEMDGLMALYGAVPFSRMLVRALYLTHSLTGDDPDAPAPYLTLVNQAFDELQPAQRREAPGVLPNFLDSPETPGL